MNVCARGHWRRYPLSCACAVIACCRDDEAGVPKEPLEVQLENLSLWHASLLTELRKFKVGLSWESLMQRQPTTSKVGSTSLQ
jgi:hypothetical protein